MILHKNSDLNTSNNPITFHNNKFYLLLHYKKYQNFNNQYIKDFNLIYLYIIYLNNMVDISMYHNNKTILYYNNHYHL